MCSTSKDLKYEIISSNSKINASSDFDWLNDDEIIFRGNENTSNELSSGLYL